MISAHYERLAAADRTFLDLEGPSTHMHVAATAVLGVGSLATPEGGVDIDRIRRYVLSRLDHIPRYRQKLAFVPVEGHPVWVDAPHFNVHYHVRHTSLPRPGSREQLQSLAARIMSQQLDRAKPLWEFWVVEGVDDGASFAIVQKAHHCMIDGVSGVDLLGVLMSPFATAEFEESAPWYPRPEPSPLRLAAAEALRRVREPFELIAGADASWLDPRRAVARVTEGLAAVGETLTASMHATSETPLNRPIGPHRRFQWLAMDLARVKAVKRRLGGTVNDVVLATTAGAVRRFLAERGESPDRLSLRANVPVSVRSDDEHGTLGNRIALWMTDLPVDEPDAVARLDRVRETTEHLKHSRQALGAQILAGVSDLTSATLLSLAVRLSAGARPYNLVVTNVPGPQMPLYFLDAPLREIYPMVNLLPNQGLGVALFSYDGRLCWGFLADWELLPDLGRFVELVGESFDELQTAAGIELQPSREGVA